jgi:nucleotide-binding universal stress UspA family protein
LIEDDLYDRMMEHLLRAQVQVTTMLTQQIAPIAPRTQDGTHGIHRVLVAFDGSDGAWAALDRAVAVAVSNHAQLTIAGVVAAPSWLSYGGPGMSTLPCSPDQLRRELDGEMLQQLAAARDEIPATVSVTTRLLHGHPAPALARLAEEGHFDLVVTGPRRIGRLGRLFHRSVTHALLSRGVTSVLAVKTVA